MSGRVPEAQVDWLPVHHYVRGVVVEPGSGRVTNEGLRISVIETSHSHFRHYLELFNERKR